MKKEEVKKLLRLEKNIDIIKVEELNNKLVVHIKSNKKKARCAHCNMFSNKIHDYLKPSRVDYGKCIDRYVYLVANKRRFECRNCKKSFTEDLGLTSKNGNISLKIKQSILKDCLNRDKTIKEIGEENNVSAKIVRKIFLEAMEDYPDNVETLPEVISFDETSTYTDEGVYSFILNDPIKRYTLDILKNRKKDFLIEYFMKVNNKKSVKVVICDLYTPYYEVVKICFPNAIFIADPFHYTRYVLDGLDKVRMRLIHEIEEDKKSKEYKILKNRTNRKLILKSFSETKYEMKQKKEKERMYEEGRAKEKAKDKFKDYWYGVMKVKKNNKYVEVFRIDRLREVLDVNEDLNKAYNLKEEFLRIRYNVKYENAKEELKKWIRSCEESKIVEMIEASKTIENWLDEIVNSFKDERYSNGFTESNNNTIDKIVDRAYGYRNFKFFRLRTLAILHQSYSIKKIKKVENKSLKKWWKFFKNR